MRLAATELSRNLYQTIQYYLIISYAFELTCTTLADTAADHLDTAKRLLSAGNYGDALTHLHEAIKQDPKNYLTYFKRATVLLALNRPRPALDDLNKAIDLNKDFTSAIVQRANLNVKLGNLDEAQKEYEEIVKHDPKNQEASAMVNKIAKLKNDFATAQQFIEEEKFEAALDKLNLIVDLTPYNTQILRLRAQAFENLGDTRRAISDYRTIAILSVDASTYFIIAKLSYKLGEVHESLENVRECLKLDPDHKECMQFYKPTKKLNNHIKNMLDSMKSNDFDDCHGQGQSALKAVGDNRELLALIYSIQSVMCHCLAKARDITSGLRICSEALDNARDGGIEGIAIDQADLICDKAELLEEKEDYEEALRMYQESNHKRASKRAKEGADRVKRLQKQRKKRDYYKILGLSRNADESEINRAYRKLAIKWHPDRHADEESKKVAQQKFMDIADAKAVLTDPEKRKQYDRGEDPLDPESKQHSHHHGQHFYGDPFAHFGGGPGGPFTFKFNFN